MSPDSPTIEERATVRRTNGEVGTCTGSGSMTPERLEWHLQNWKGWMHAGHVTEGFLKETVGLFSGGSAHFDDMVEASDRRCARACDTVINDLPPAHAAAIYRCYLFAVWRFPRNNYAECLERGKERVKAGLERKGIW